MGSSLIVGLKTRLATSRSTKQDVWRGRCCACLRQWLRHVQGRLRRRRRPQGRLPLHCRTSPPPGCHGRYGTEGCLRRLRGPVQEGYPHPEVPRRARNHHQLGRHGEDLAPHLLQRAPRCPRGAARPPDWGSPQPQGQQGEDDPDHVRDLQHARHVRRHPGCPLSVRLWPYHRYRHGLRRWCFPHRPHLRRLCPPPSCLPFPPSSRCGSPSRSTTSAAHPLSTGSASKCFHPKTVACSNKYPILPCDMQIENVQKMFTSHLEQEYTTNIQHLDQNFFCLCCIT